MNRIMRNVSVAFGAFGLVYVVSSLIAGLVMESHDYLGQAWLIPNWPVWLKILLVISCIVANIPTMRSFWRSVYGTEKDQKSSRET